MSACEIRIPRQKRFNQRDLELGYVKMVTASSRLQEIHNSPALDKDLNDTYLSALEHEPHLFSQLFDNYPDEAEYPKSYRSVKSAETTIQLANHHPSLSTANHVVSVTRGCPYLPFSELFLRSTIVTNVKNALKLLSDDGGLILEFNFVTLSSRLMLQIMTLLMSSFQSTEFSYMERGTVIIWFR